MRDRDSRISGDVFVFVSFRPTELVQNVALCDPETIALGGEIMHDAARPTTSGLPFGQRRTVPRYSLIATAEVIEFATDARMSGRLSEISRKGCYVDLLNTLPVDTGVQLRITRDRGSFTSMGRIIYVQEGIGMGVAFLDPPQDQLRILDSWLAELAV
jgi:hypothetical protein